MTSSEPGALEASPGDAQPGHRRIGDAQPGSRESPDHRGEARDHPKSELSRTTGEMRADLQQASDDNLVVAIARYRDDALAEVFRRHSGAVFALARRLLWDAGVAEEVVQEIFVRLWNEPERFDGQRGTLRSFLLSQTHSRAVDLLRAETARARREEREARMTAGAGYDLEREVGDLFVAEHVRSALSELTDAERRPIELAYFGGHSYREVAEVLGEPEGTVKSRIRSGLRRMHQQLAAVGVVGGNEGT
ncbi:MAG: RNA polymerase sigma factor [Acidimicrobiales bacterium]